MKYDVATKILVDRAARKILERFLGMDVEYVEQVDELPQETVSVKRSDYVLHVRDTQGKTFMVIFEFLSRWKRAGVLNLIDYTVRASLKFSLPVVPVILLLKPSPHAGDHFEEGGLSFRYKLICLYEIAALDFMREAEVDLLPLVGVMKGSREAVWEAEKRIYASELPTEEKADLLTILAIFAGLKDRELTRKLVQRRRDIMIESYAYEIIKQEGFEQGLQQGREEGLQQGRRQGELDRARKAIYEVLEARFEAIEGDLVEKMEEITLIPVLESLLKMSVKVKDLETFREILTRVSQEKRLQV